MAQIMTSTEQEQLTLQAQLKDFYTNDYLEDTSNDNFKLISGLFFNDDVSKTKSYNIGTNIFTTISDTLTFFIWNPITDINVSVTPMVRDFVNIGQGAIWLKKVNDELIPYHIPWEDLILSNNTWKTYKLYTTIEKNKTNYYVLKQEYKVWEVISTLYSVTNASTLTSGTIVDLDTISQTSHLEEVIKTDLPNNWLFIVSRRDNIAGKNQSELDKVRKQVYSLDRKQVMFETQFLQETEQYKIFENIHIPNSCLTPDWTVDLIKLWKVLSTTTGEKWDIRYVRNENSLIWDAIAYEEKQIAKIATATNIPLDFFWLNTSGTTSGSSRTIMISAFIKKVQWYRDEVEKVVLDMLNTYIDQKQKYNDEDVTESILWEDIVAKDDKELVEELNIARTAWLISQYSWVKKYLQLSNDETDTEIERINSEVAPVEAVEEVIV